MKLLDGHIFRCMVLVALLGLTVSAQQAVEAPRPDGAVFFTNVDIVVDPHGAPLAAYQVEFVADPSRVTLVGIEGGQHAAFKEPPYYDAKALSGNRVILAALNTADDLPREKTRVARLHLQIKGAQQLPEFEAKLVVAASSDEKTIEADVTVSEGAAR